MFSADQLKVEVTVRNRTFATDASCKHSRSVIIFTRRTIYVERNKDRKKYIDEKLFHYRNFVLPSIVQYYEILVDLLFKNLEMIINCYSLYRRWKTGSEMDNYTNRKISNRIWIFREKSLKCIVNHSY